MKKSSHKKSGIFRNIFLASAIVLFFVFLVFVIDSDLFNKRKVDYVLVTRDERRDAQIDKDVFCSILEPKGFFKISKEYPDAYKSECFVCYGQDHVRRETEKPLG